MLFTIPKDTFGLLSPAQAVLRLSAPKNLVHCLQSRYAVRARKAQMFSNGFRSGLLTGQSIALIFQKKNKLFYLSRDGLRRCLAETSSHYCVHPMQRVVNSLSEFSFIPLRFNSYAIQQLVIFLSPKMHPKS